MRDDPEAARAEYLAEFRSDIAALIDPDLVKDCTRPKPRELPRVAGVQYLAFVDPSGGGADEFTLAIGHREGDAAIVDLVQGRKGSPAGIVAEYAEVLKRYNITKVTGDRYAARWPRDEFQKHGVQYDVSELDRSGLYLEMLAAFNSGRVELPPDDVTARQFVALERRTARSGKDQIDHPPGAHDDRANACAGLVALLVKRATAARIYLSPRHLPKSAPPPKAQEIIAWDRPL